MLPIHVMYGVIIDQDDFFDIVLSDIKQDMDEPTMAKFRKGYCMMNNTLTPPDSLVELVESYFDENQDSDYNPVNVPFDVALIPHDQLEQKNKMVIGTSVWITDTHVNVEESINSFHTKCQAILPPLQRIVDRGQPAFHFVNMKCNCCYD